MDAPCKIQGSIHVFRLVNNMCPGKWVHITLIDGAFYHMINILSIIVSCLSQISEECYNRHYIFIFRKEAIYGTDSRSCVYACAGWPV